jgi:natural product precursor
MKKTVGNFSNNVLSAEQMKQVKGGGVWYRCDCPGAGRSAWTYTSASCGDCSEARTGRAGCTVV